MLRSFPLKLKFRNLAPCLKNMWSASAVRLNRCVALVIPCCLLRKSFQFLRLSLSHFLIDLMFFFLMSFHRRYLNEDFIRLHNEIFDLFLPIFETWSFFTVFHGTRNFFWFLKLIFKVIHFTNRFLGFSCMDVSHTFLLILIVQSKTSLNCVQVLNYFFFTDYWLWLCVFILGLLNIGG